MSAVTIIFPHQLFASHPALRKNQSVFLIEDPLFFGDKSYPIAFHKQKLILHRASMKRYAAEILNSYPVTYIAYSKLPPYQLLFAQWKTKGVTDVHCVDPDDYILRQRLVRAANANRLLIHWYNSPSFLLSFTDIPARLPKSSHYSMNSFYIAQRKRMNLLITQHKPVGGAWSFDRENRKAYDFLVPLPPENSAYTNGYLTEAAHYVTRNFPNNPGALSPWYYPTNHAEAQQHLETFLYTALVWFGPYEDAILANERHLFHSVLSPLLNIGLLEPHTVIEKTIQYAAQHTVPLQSLEGFLRQIIGWREFMRGIYRQEGSAIRKSNQYNNTRKIPPSFWNGSTGIPPIDRTIQKILSNGYAHHIERLMILGNFMLLCEFDPNEVYRWFMTFFIDAYDWVMVPNVYSMSQYADGGLITTKPYISSSRYILRMSNYQRGDWCTIWDSLYWRFIDIHQATLTKNPRMVFMVAQWQKKPAQTKRQLLDAAQQFLDNLI